MDYLRELRLHLGDPTATLIGERAGLSQSTVSEAIAGRSTPALSTVVKITQALSGDVGYARDLWIAMKLELLGIQLRELREIIERRGDAREFGDVPQDSPGASDTVIRKIK